MYIYRKLSKQEQNELLQYRKKHEYPLHEPPRSLDQSNFLITAATFEHRNIFFSEISFRDVLYKVPQVFKETRFPANCMGVSSESLSSASTNYQYEHILGMYTKDSQHGSILHKSFGQQARQKDLVFILR